MGPSRKALVASIKPGHGGVAAMLRVLCDTLVTGGYEPIVAHYEPYSVSPELSAPLHRLFDRRPGVRIDTALDRFECHAIGAWLPELEFTHYRATDTWRRLIDDADIHLVASGNCLAGTAFASLDAPFLGWFATKWDDDRRVRAAAFPRYRRIIDRVINGPVIRRLERRILSRGHIMALSEHTRRQFQEMLPDGAVVGRLPMPIDSEWFQPASGAVVRGRIGFAARYNDPRKNISGLIDAFDHLAALNNHELFLTGDTPGSEVLGRRARAAGPSRIHLLPLLNPAEYREFLQSLDVFVVSSDQEGLCIAALEAMACGCPVISTRCGGPEEFVVDGETGYLTSSDPREIAARIREVTADRRLRERLGSNARNVVTERYTRAAFERPFWRAFGETFGAAALADAPAAPRSVHVAQTER